MNSIARRLSSLFRQSVCTTEPLNSRHYPLQQVQQCRGIRVRVYGGNLERAMAVVRRTLQSREITRMIKQEQRFNIKNYEKRVLAEKDFVRKIQSDALSRKLKAMMIKKDRSP